MKKIISILLSLILVSSTFTFYCFTSNATNASNIDISDYDNPDLDLTSMTMDDLSEMSPDEFGQLIQDFEKVYDPYDSYDESEEVEQNPNARWTSGDINSDDEWTEVGCHEYMTMQACLIMINDVGFFSSNASNSVAISLSIALGSLLPDDDERGFPLFEGHFYNPHTGKNYSGDSSNTAKTNAINHFNKAISYMNANNESSAYEYLGRAIHYMQDVNEPHHAANIIAVVNPCHSSFENFAFDNIESYIGNYTTMSNSYYSKALNNTLGNLINTAAFAAYNEADRVDKVLFKGDWDEVAELTTINATTYTVMLMYKFAHDSGTTLYK